MSKQLTSALRTVLMEDGQVCLPTLGTLTLVRQPALVSLLEGKATPPAERVTFNANLVLDDGRLLRELNDEQFISDSVQQTRESLDAGRTVVLDGIGKLYKHHDGEIRFTPSGENFSKESFGLPNIDLKPIVRKERRPASSPDPMIVGRTDKVKKKIKERVGWMHNPQLRSILWYVAAGLAILLAIYLVLKLTGAVGNLFTNDPKAPIEREAAPRPRLNVPPTEPSRINDAPRVDANRIQPEPAPRIEDSRNPVTVPATPPTSGSTAPESTEEPATRITPVPIPSVNTAIIAIGLYGRQRNVDKQVRRIREAGYTPYTRPEGPNTRVGVELTYDDERELQTVLRDVQARYTEDAFIMRVNGEERRPE